MNSKMCMEAGENRTKTELSCGQVAEGDRSALRKDLLYAPAWIADLLLPLTETPPRHEYVPANHHPTTPSRFPTSG